MPKRKLGRHYDVCCCYGCSVVPGHEADQEREVCVWRVDLAGEGREIKQGSARWEYNAFADRQVFLHWKPSLCWPVGEYTYACGFVLLYFLQYSRNYTERWEA